jgi:hypothetical protein
MKNLMSHIGKAGENLNPGGNGTKGNVEVKGRAMVSLNFCLSRDLADAP